MEREEVVRKKIIFENIIGVLIVLKLCNNMDEKMLRNQLRLKFKKSKYRYLSFPMGNKASIDDLMMSNLPGRF